jgi:hypothetical protein
VAVRTCWKRAVAAGHIATKTGAQLGNQTRSSDRVRSRRVNRCETDILREKHSAGDCSRIRVGRLLTETSEMTERVVVNESKRKEVPGGANQLESKRLAGKPNQPAEATEDRVAWNVL